MNTTVIASLFSATLADLLGASASAYTDLAAKADRHASDVRTLSEAWPR